MDINEKQIIKMLETKISNDKLREIVEMLQMSPFLGYKQIKELILNGEIKLTPEEEELLSQYWWNIY